MAAHPLPGLCSVTFRSLPPAAIIDLAARAGLEAIEWGGDVHVPPGDFAAARAVRGLTEAAGLHLSSYGSYLRAGRVADDPGAVDRTLETAAELGARNVRVWAKGSSAVNDLRVICTAAAARSLSISVEFHPGTATETAAGANELLDAVAAPNLFTYWQPDPSLDASTMRDELHSVAPRLSHLHVFWWRADRSRLPLADGAALWPDALAKVGGSWAEGNDRIAFLEFVADDDPDRFLGDAATLKEWLEA